MEIITPDTYPNMIGTGLFLVATICLFVSFLEDKRRHATKLFSIFVVAALSLFSAHWATYFAAIFIVATAVTELEFLQTLAAIIRKDKNYFEFRKETLTKEDNLRRKAEEAIEEELLSNEDSAPNVDKSKIDLSNLLTLPRNESMRLSLDVEDKTLDYLESKYGKIERNVRFRKNGDAVEFDGVISSTDNTLSRAFEIRWTKNPEHFMPFINHSIRRSKDLLERQQRITGSKPELHLVVILNSLSSTPAQKIERMNEKAKDAGIVLTFLSLKEIGFEVINENA